MEFCELKKKEPRVDEWYFIKHTQNPEKPKTGNDKNENPHTSRVW
jgi:hypothetical protein